MKTLKIVCISDTHSLHDNIWVPDGDIVICSGDISNVGEISDIQRFLDWYQKLPHTYKILTPGNHDWGFEKNELLCSDMCKERGIIYLNDSGYKINGIKIWGTASQKPFCNWAFNHSDSKRLYIYDMIPSDTNILITHGPPYGILDDLHRENLGDRILLNKINTLKELKAMVFGHIHNGRGTKRIGDILYINASCCNEEYEPINDPIIFSINSKKMTKISKFSSYKVCNKCQKEKHLRNFYYSKYKNTYKHICKECFKKRPQPNKKEIRKKILRKSEKL